MQDEGRSRPQVVAHRGSSEINAEHTLGAYIAALDEGAEGLECDVRLTADGRDRWRGVVRESDLALYDSKLRTDLSPICARWLACGRLPAN